VAAGGAVFNNQGLRVMGVLQCTRAIGDKDLQAYGVIPRPEVLSVPRSSQAEFLVLATDGLWDVLANEVGLGGWRRRADAVGAARGTVGCLLLGGTLTPRSLPLCPLPQEVYQYAHKTLQKVADRCPRAPSANGACCGCQAAGVAARALSQCARKQRGSRDDITVLLANMAAACQCLKLPTLLSSSSKGAAAGSLRGACGGGGSVACDGMPSSSSNARVAPLHSSPAALDAGVTLAQHQQQPQSSQPPQLPDAVAKQPQQQPQQHDQGAADDTALRLQAVRQCVRHDAPPWPAGLQLQPSVAPSSAAGSGGSSGVHNHAAGAAGGGGAAALTRGGVLSDLALSSPFAMMLCHDASAKGMDVDHVLHAAVAVAGAGKSAPPGMIAGALLTAADRVGRSAPTLSSGDVAGAARKRSLSAALVSSRSCGSVGVQGRMGSSELPVVVLT
jgi:hypothetical protein